MGYKGTRKSNHSSSSKMTGHKLIIDRLVKSKSPAFVALALASAGGKSFKPVIKHINNALTETDKAIIATDKAYRD